MSNPVYLIIRLGVRSTNISNGDSKTRGASLAEKIEIKIIYYEIFYFNIFI